MPGKFDRDNPKVTLFRSALLELPGDQRKFGEFEKTRRLQSRQMPVPKLKVRKLTSSLDTISRVRIRVIWHCRNGAVIFLIRVNSEQCIPHK